MRIGINGRFLAARPTGVQRFALEVCRRLAARPGAVLLLPAGVGADGMPGGVEVDRGRLPGKAWEQLELPGRARRRGVDVTLHPANAAPLWGGPHVVVLHDVTPLTHPQHFTPSYRAWVRIAHGAAARRAARVVTVSRWSAAEIGRVLGLPRHRIRVVPQGAAPLDRPADAEAVRGARRRHGLKGPYFLAVTGGDPRKGSALLEGVWKAWGPDAPPLVVVGARHGRVHLSATATGPARALGHVGDEELRALYTGASALLFPSEAEGFGRPPLEALACGTRVVVGPYAAGSEILDGTVERVSPDPGAWREALEAILAESPGERRDKVEAGRRFAAGYRWEDAVEGILQSCREAMEGGG